MPEIFGRYEVKSIIESGGMGTVYLAYDPRFDRDVALKVLHDHISDDVQARTRFMLEVQTITRLEHAAIVPVYDFGEMENKLYFVMRWMKGNSLAHRLQKGPMALTTTAKNLKRLGSALDLVHQKGIIHRDLKPANILFDEEDKAYLSDFGIAKIIEATTALTGTTGVIGTWAYMSPERFQSNFKVDHRTDIYALGVILYEMLTAQKPFQAETMAEWLGAHINLPVPSIHEARVGLPAGCDSIIQKAMAKLPEDRFDSAGHMAETFESLTKPSIDYQEQEKIWVPIIAPYKNESVSPKDYQKPSFFRERLLTRWKLLLPIVSIASIVASSLLFINLFSGQTPASPLSTPVAAATTPDTLEATEAPSSSPVSAATEIFSSTIPGSVIILNHGDSAIWQRNTTLQRIPESGLVPFSGTNDPLLFQSNAEPMELVLRDKTSLFLSNNTELSIIDIRGVNGADETLLTLHRGSLVVLVDNGKVRINSSLSNLAYLEKGILGVSENEAGIDVDCLQGTCQLIVSNTSVLTLSGGDHVWLDESGEIAGPDGARYSEYSNFVNALAITPTPTMSPSATTTTPPAATMTPTLIPTIPSYIPTAASSAATNLIVFTCFINENDDLCTVDPSNGSQERITANEATDFYASIAPNNGQILFSSRRDGSFLMYSVNSDGSGLRLIGPTHLGAIFAPVVSPDGEKVAFTVATNGTQKIWVMNRDGNELIVLTDFDANSVDAVWSPDGQQIAFASDMGTNGGGMAHYIINIDGSDLRKITTDVKQIGGRSDWSPDGRWLTFYAGPDDDRDIYIVAIDGSAIYQLTDGGGNLAPSFSPDGDWITFTSYRDGDAEIFIMRLDGSELRQLTFNGYPDWQPRWGVKQ